MNLSKTNTYGIDLSVSGMFLHSENEINKSVIPDHVNQLKRELDLEEAAWTGIVIMRHTGPYSRITLVIKI